MKIREIITERISPSELNWLDNLADRLFGEFGIDVEFTTHFFDRANDDRAALVSREGEQNITAEELAKMFLAAYESAKNQNSKYPKVTDVRPATKANLTDYFSKINIPFIMNKAGNKMKMVPTTVMRTKNFHNEPGQRKIPVNTQNVSL